VRLVADHDVVVCGRVDLSEMRGACGTSRIHAALEHVGTAYTLTDLNSTNATRTSIAKQLGPDTATPISGNGDTLCTGQ